MGHVVILQKADTSPCVVRHATNKCSACPVQARCVPAGFTAGLMHEFEQLIRSQVRVGKGKTLYRMGDKFEALYAIRSGSFKTVALSEDGREQVTGLHLPAEVIGTDGIDYGVYLGEEIAL